MSDNRSRIQAVDAQTRQAIKERYQTEYFLKARAKLGFWNIFLGSDARLKKIEDSAARLLEKDILNGILPTRLAEDCGREEASARAASAAIPSAIDYVDMTQELIEEQHQHARRPEPQNYNVNIPDVVRLQQIDDTGFLFFVLESLDPFNLASPGYAECDELKAIRLRLIPQGYEHPPTYASVVAKRFTISRAGEVTRDDQVKNTMILMHSDTQEGLINKGVQAISHYNRDGKIPLRLREEFMLEQTKEYLRTAGYDFTPRYELFCMNVLHHVSMQMESFTTPMPQPQPDEKAAQRKSTANGSLPKKPG